MINNKRSGLKTVLVFVSLLQLLVYRNWIWLQEFIHDGIISVFPWPNFGILVFSRSPINSVFCYELLFMRKGKRNEISRKFVLIKVGKPLKKQSERFMSLQEFNWVLNAHTFKIRYFARHTKVIYDLIFNF